MLNIDYHRRRGLRQVHDTNGKICKETGPDIGPGPWIAHAIIRNTTSKRIKAKENCWDNRLCGKPIESSSNEEELKHQLVTIFQLSTSGVPLRRRSPPKLKEIILSRHQATGGSRPYHNRSRTTPPPSPCSRHQDLYDAGTIGQQRHGRESTSRRPIATLKSSTSPEPVRAWDGWYSIATHLGYLNLERCRYASLS